MPTCNFVRKYNEENVTLQEKLCPGIKKLKS